MTGFFFNPRFVRAVLITAEVTVMGDWYYRSKLVTIELGDMKQNILFSSSHNGCQLKETRKTVSRRLYPKPADNWN
jgi:hypothetical protein